MLPYHLDNNSTSDPEVYNKIFNIPASDDWYPDSPVSDLETDSLAEPETPLSLVLETSESLETPESLVIE